MTRVTVSVQREDFDCQQALDSLLAQSSGIGAVVHFVGIVRNDDRHSLASLLLEHYPGMTERAIAGIAEAACERWQLQGVSVIHRVGELFPGQRIVLVAVASAHRQAAFQAAEYIMDYLKSRAPFWKKETDTHGRSHWVQPRETDWQALERW